MVKSGKVVVFDIDGTLCELKAPGQSYRDVKPDEEMLKFLNHLQRSGVYIILHSSRQMRTYEGNIGKLMANTALTLHRWLDDYNIPFDELHLGKPWCSDGFYVDDKALRPNEVKGKTYEECVKYLKEVSR